MTPSELSLLLDRIEEIEIRLQKTDRVKKVRFPVDKLGKYYSDAVFTRYGFHPEITKKETNSLRLIMSYANSDNPKEVIEFYLQQSDQGFLKDNHSTDSFLVNIQKLIAKMDPKLNEKINASK